MDGWYIILMPFVLLLARVTAFLSAAPIFGSQSVPNAVKAGLAVWVTIFFAIGMHYLPTTGLWLPPAFMLHMHWMKAVLLVIQEVIIGVALGLAARIVFLAIQQGGEMVSQAMGLTDAGVIDPTSGEETQSMGIFLEMTMTVAFLGIGGHQLLIILLARTFKAFPVGAAPDISAMTQGLIAAGGMMLVLGLKLAAPLIAAFLVLSIVLAILARVLPEMNILFESYPLRVGVGFLLTAAIVPSLGTLTMELASWMNQFLK